MPVIISFAQSNGTTAPSRRQMIRRSGRTQVNWLVPPHRMDLGHGKRRNNPGSAAAIACGAAMAAAVCREPDIALLPDLIAVGSVLAQKSGQCLFRGRGTRAAFGAGTGLRSRHRPLPAGQCVGVR